MATTLNEREAGVLLTAATSAPSLHNTQPWKFAVQDDRVEVYADAERQLRQADPNARQLLISCGAAVLNLRLAAFHLGYEPRVRVLPNVREPGLLATVTMTGHHAGNELFERMYQAIPLRHTNRFPFDDVAVPDEVVRDLVESAEAEGAGLEVPADEAEWSRLAELVRRGDRDEDLRPWLTTERAHWTGVDPDRLVGVPGYALGPLADDPDALVRDLRRGSPVEGRSRTSFEARPVLAVLWTRHDDRVSWVRAGQALQSVLLTATMHGLSASFLNQAVETPALRRQLLAAGTQPGHAQMVLRLGHGQPLPPTPRRDLSDSATYGEDAPR